MGYGGSIRGILANNPSANIIAVDINNTSLETCENLYKEFFPELLSQITFVHHDAYAFLKDAKEGIFDAICIDLYNSNGYPNFLLETDFWNHINISLSKKGIVLVNSWGLPIQLDPLSHSTAQTKMLELILQKFHNIKTLPSRRNITFLACKDNFNFEYPKAHTYLTPLDNIGLKLLFFKSIIDEKLIEKEFSINNTEILYSIKDFDELMYKQWPSLLKEINNIRKNIDLESISQVNDLIHQPKDLQKFTEYSLKYDRTIANTVPTLAGALAFNGAEPLDWYIDWLLEYKNQLIQIDIEWFIKVAIWQAYQIATNPYSQKNNWLPYLETLLESVQPYVTIKK